jgi:alpha-ribazole phosphatase
MAEPGTAGPAPSAAGTALWLWRHPRPVGAAGRCIGRTDLQVDPRRARRLAHRIEATVRREQLPRQVWTSPLARCAAVGRWLARRGFVHCIDARLAELDFGRWDGQDWRAIDRAEVARWEGDFLHHAPGGGEALAGLLQRVHAFLAERLASHPPALLVVGHAGWIQAAGLPAGTPPQAAHWARAPAYGALTRGWTCAQRESSGASSRCCRP